MKKNRKSPKTTRSKTVSRRNFLAAGAVGVAAATVLPSRVLGLDDNQPPSEKLNVAGVGVGGTGVAGRNSAGERGRVVRLVLLPPPRGAGCGVACGSICRTGGTTGCGVPVFMPGKPKGVPWRAPGLPPKVPEGVSPGCP